TRPPPAGSAPQALAGLLRRPLLGLLGLVVFLYVGAEMGVASWIAEYFVGVHGVSVSAAAYTVSVFWGGLLCGRFLAWAAYRGHRQEHFLVALTVTATLGTGLALVAPSAPLALALFFAGGLGYSAIYPVVMTITGLRFRDEPSLAIGAVSTSGGIGSMAFPYIMSGIADRYGVARGFWFYGAVTAAMVAVALAVLWVNRGSAGERDDQAGLVGEPPGAVPPPDLRT
ncbi:MAG: MFS transporter, partial [Gemmatimonadota bacterium]